jgi:hypothetical protein
MPETLLCSFRNVNGSFMPKREDMEKGNVRFGTMDFSDEPYLTQYKWPTLSMTGETRASGFHSFRACFSRTGLDGIEADGSPVETEGRV